MRKSLALSLSALTASAVCLVGISSAHAATSPENTGIVAAANGSAGVAQTIDVLAPKNPSTTVTVVASLGNADTSMSVTLDAKGQGSVSWTPQSSGTWTVDVSDSSVNLRASKVVISAVPTVTDIYIPNKASYFTPMGLISVVHATDGDAPVSGTVTFYEAYLGRLGAVEVSSSTQEYAVANFPWTPQGARTYALWSTFTPSNDMDTDTPATQSSVSGTSYLTVEEHPVPLQLLMPPTMRIGKPALVFAQLPDIERATVSLLVDDRPVSPARVTEGGVSPFIWTPVHTGVTDVQLEFLSEHHPRADRIITQTVNVLPKQIPNPISVTPVIDGVAGTPWAEDDVLSYAAGTAINLVSSTGNGAAVTVSQRGKCLVSGATLYVPSAGGGCKVTFSAPGDATYASNSAQVIVTASVTPATPAKKKK